MRFNGLGVSPGVAIGKALIIVKKETSIFKVPLRDEEIDHEIQKFKNAVELAKSQIVSIKERIAMTVVTPIRIPNVVRNDLSLWVLKV